MKNVNVEETIARVTLSAQSQALLSEGDLQGALNPQLFGSQHTAMITVANFVEALSDFQSQLLIAGLTHAISSVHEARVVFGQIESCYELDGIGLELKDDSVTLLDGDETVEDLLGPLRVTFTKSA